MIVLKIGNIFTDVSGYVSDDLYHQIEKKLSFRPKNFQYVPSYNRSIKDKITGKIIRRGWDGYKRCCWRNKKQTYFPTGLISLVTNFFDENQIPHKIIDLRHPPDKNIDICTDEKIEYRDYQKQVIDRSCEITRGLIQLPTGSGKCINENSLCITDQGMLFIKEFAEKEAENYSVRGLNLNVSTPLNSGTDISTYIYKDGVSLSNKINLLGNYSIIGTPEHKILAVDDSGEIVWKKTKNISVGDVCVINYKNNLFGSSRLISEDEAYWMGILTGDGSINQKGTIKLTNEDEHIINFAKNFCSNCGLKLYIKQHGTSINCREMFIHSIKYRKRLYEFGMKYVTSCNKEIPLEIRKSPKNIVAAFIRGLFETDGWIDKRPVICISLCSKVLIDQLQTILLNFGIISSCTIKKTKKSDAHVLSVYHHSIEQFNNKIGLDPHGKKYHKLKNILSNRKKHKFNDNFDLARLPCLFFIRLRHHLRKEYGYHGISNALKQANIKYKTFSSWLEGRRSPSRLTLGSLLEFFNTFKTSIKSSYLFLPVVKTEKIESCNYDFIIPNSHSFVAQGFVNHNTVISAGIIEQLKVSPFLFFVTSKDLLWQAKNCFESILRQHNSSLQVGQIGAGVIDIRDVNVITAQTAVRALGVAWNKDTKFDDEDTDDDTDIRDRKKDILELLHSAKGSISDECQHWRAKTCQLIAREMKSAYYTFGTSATAYRDEGDDMLIQACFGKIICQISASELIRQGWLVRPHIKMLKLKQPVSQFKQWQSIYKEQVVENERYNSIICSIANKFCEDNRRLVLVLTRIISHGQYLSDNIKGSIFLSGDSPKKLREQKLEQLRRREISCIVSSAIFDEGIDVCPLNTLILAGQGISRVRAMQRVGRTMRPFTYEDDTKKDKSIVVDFSLCNQKYLRAHAKERLKMYKEEPEYLIQEMDID